MVSDKAQKWHFIVVLSLFASVDKALCFVPALKMTFVGNKLSHPVIAKLLFHLHQMFQVVHSEKPLYVQAGNCVEASEWQEVLSQVSRCNEGRLTTFHPSNYTSGAWQCCKNQSNNAPGCKPCTAWVFPLPQHHSEGKRGLRGFSILTAVLWDMCCRSQ